MLKVAILVNSLGYGGNERSAVNIANALQDAAEVTILTQEDCGNHYGYHGKTICLNTPCANSICGKILNSIKRTFRLRKTVQQEGFDVVFIILPVTNPLNYLHLKCRKIVSCRDCGDLILHKHYYIAMTRLSDGIICNSEHQRKLLCEFGPLISKRTQTIYNIVDETRIRKLYEQMPDQRFVTFTKGCRIIAASGRFVEVKGFQHLLKAFKLLTEKETNVRLVLMGDGECKPDIEMLIKELDLSQFVLLMGFQENPFVHIRHSDVFVLSSLYEGFPNMLVEAMACGTPVIATDCPSGPSEILSGHAELGMALTEFGVLVPAFPSSSQGWDKNEMLNEHRILADAMYYLLEHQQKANAMTKAAIERVKDFSADRIRTQWMQVLRG